MLQAVSVLVHRQPTSRGLKEDDFDRVAEAIASVIKEGEDGVAKARKIVDELTDKYPLK